ncbi:hypothetical protein QBC35DRAFT_539852 [Podospora australis]|uniref:Rhodopsin domain-containing protein n=1 Tax=Podospora australis TaxID=1536484 RepID=A0AAN6WM42_9PEZI|nr:hypothetical protein QBC35DRAFT_539852 [Podospora australis]
MSATAVSHTTLLAILWSGTALSLVVFLFRLTFRIKVMHRLKLDDYLVIASFAFYLASTIVYTVLARSIGTIIESWVGTDSSADILDLIARAALGLHALLASYVMLCTSLWLIKFALMAFFRGLGRKMRSQRILWWSVLVYIVASYFVAIGTMDWQCLTSNPLDMSANCDGRPRDAVYFVFTANRIQLAMDISSDLF